MIKSLIVAHGENYEIGFDNQLLWHLSDDLKNFKNHTTGKPIVMGRKTYDSIGRPLPKRTNIILTRQADLKIEGCLVMHSYEEVEKWAADNSVDELVYIGGGKVYENVLPRVDKMYITKVHGSFNADTYFPQYNLDNYQILNQYTHEKDEKNEYTWEFLELKLK